MRFPKSTHYPCFLEISHLAHPTSLHPTWSKQPQTLSSTVIWMFVICLHHTCLTCVCFPFCLLPLAPVWVYRAVPAGDPHSFLFGSPARYVVTCSLLSNRLTFGSSASHWACVLFLTTAPPAVALTRATSPCQGGAHPTSTRATPLMLMGARLPTSMRAQPGFLAQNSETKTKTSLSLPSSWNWKRLDQTKKKPKTAVLNQP